MLVVGVTGNATKCSTSFEHTVFRGHAVSQRKHKRRDKTRSFFTFSLDINAKWSGFIATIVTSKWHFVQA